MRFLKASIYVGVFLLLLLSIGFSMDEFKAPKEYIEKNRDTSLSDSIDGPKIETKNSLTEENSNEASVEKNEDTALNDLINADTVDAQGTLIRVFKKQRLMKLYVDGQLVNDFKVGLGFSPTGDKSKEGDGKTPVGQYYICTRNDKSRFTLFLGISYPNIEDAKKGLESGLINEDTFNRIKSANERKVQPPWKTPLGGEVGIHGSGNSSDWTWGCVALSDEDIKTIWKHAKLKTPIEIYE